LGVIKEFYLGSPYTLKNAVDEVVMGPLILVIFRATFI
jgi:hypothetical protein